MPLSIGVKAGFGNLAKDHIRLLAGEGLLDYTEFSMSYQVDPRDYREPVPARVVHAPNYSSHRTNPVDPSDRDRSLRFLEDASAAADVLGSSVIVVHPERRTSPECSAEHLVSVLQEHGDPRCAVENMPCPGFFATDAEEARGIMAAAGCGLVLDLAHAACFAFSEGLDLRAYLESFIALGPVLYHASDTPLLLGTGNYSNGMPSAAPGPWCEDMHLPLGDGDLGWAAILPLLPDGALVTLETPMRVESQRRDAGILRKLRP